MSVVDKNRFKRQLKVQLCRTCVDYKHQRDFYMKKCKYYENLLAEYRNKSANTGTSPVETEVTQPKLIILPHIVLWKDAGAELVSHGTHSRSHGNCFPAISSNTQVHTEPETPPQEPDSVPTGENSEPKDPGGPCEPPGKDATVAGRSEACYQVCRWQTESEVCGVTLSVEDLLTHVSQTHAGPEDSNHHVCMWHACDRTDRVFFFKRLFMAHIQAHVGENLFRCRTKTCRKWFRTEPELSRHRKVHKTSEIAGRKIPCPHKPCRRMFWNAEYLRKHVANKHTPKEHRCPEESCGMVFKTKDRVKEHDLRVHQGVQLYKCAAEGCGRSFNSRNHLVRHIRLLHLQEKPFRCTVPGCNMEFAYPTTYETHRKTHLASSE